MDQLHDKSRGGDSTGKAGASGHLDPTARKDEDVNKPEEGIQTAEVSRTNRVPALAAGTTFLSDQSLRLDQRAQAAPSATELLVSVLHFKWTILAVCILVAAPVIAAIWTQIIPQYQARAVLRIQPIVPHLVFPPEDDGLMSSYDSFVNTQASVMRSPTVLERVLDQPEVQETQWYKNPQEPLLQHLRGNPMTLTERLKSSLSVEPRLNTELVDVTFVDPSAEEAKIIVDTILDQYMRYVGETSDATEDKLFRELVDLYKSLENEMQGLDTTAGKLRKSLRTGDSQQLVSSKRLRLDGIEAGLSNLRMTISLLESEVERNVESEVELDGTVKASRYYADSEWLTRDVNVMTIRNRIANSAMTANHPRMVQMAKDLTFAEELLRAREMQLDQLQLDPATDAGVPTIVFDANGLGSLAGVGLASLENQLIRAKQQEQLLLAESEKQEAEFERLLDTANLIQTENDALLYKRTLFDTVRQRLDRKNMERNVPGAIEVFSRASTSSRPYNDRRVVFTAMVLIMGLSMGGGVAFLRASNIQGIYAPKDMPQPMQVSFLGYIPLARTRRRSGDEVNSDTIESIRVVRTTLLSRLDGRTNSTLLITSATPGTGKSTFTMMLAESLAKIGKKVLVIDADFHKMTLTKRLNLSGKSGFIDSLHRETVRTRHIFPLETSGLSVLPSGTSGSDHGTFDEVSTTVLNASISKLRKQYEIILLDCSPILAIADSAILSSLVDGTVVVEREAVSRRPALLSALARLNSAGGRLLGTVFIGSKYGYGYYLGKATESQLDRAGTKQEKVGA